MREPRVAKDGLCAAKGCTKRRTVPKTYYATREMHANDPFCSADCCRKHYKVVTSTVTGRKEDERASNDSRGGYVESFSIGRGRKGIGRP